MVMVDTQRSVGKSGRLAALFFCPKTLYLVSPATLYLVKVTTLYLVKVTTLYLVKPFLALSKPVTAISTICK